MKVFKELAIIRLLSIFLINGVLFSPVFEILPKGQVYAAPQDQGDSNDDYDLYEVSGEEVEAALAEYSEDLKEQAERERFIHEIEEGHLDAVNAVDTDAWGLIGQTVDLVEEGLPPRRFNLAESSGSVPVPAGLHETRVRSAQQGIVIEGLINQQVVARHWVPNVGQVVAVVEDEEFIVLLDKDGYLSVLDRPMLFSHGFKGFVPVYRRLYRIDHALLESVRGQGEGLRSSAAASFAHLQMAFATRGFRPFSDSEATGEAPTDSEGNEIHAAQNLIVYSRSPSGERRRVLELPIDVIREGVIERLQKRLLRDAFVVNPTDNVQNILEVAKEIENIEHTEAPLRENDAFVQAERLALRSFGRDTTDRLLVRLKALQAHRGRQQDRYDLATWIQSFEEIQSRARARLEDPEISARERQLLARQLESDDFGVSYRELLKDAKKSQEVRKKWYEKWLTPKRLKLLGGIAVATGLHFAYTGALEGDFGDAWPLKVAQWIDLNIMPEVLRNAEYRPTLIKSTVAILSMIPVAVLTSVASAPMLRGVAKGFAWLARNPEAMTNEVYWKQPLPSRVMHLLQTRLAQWAEGLETTAGRVSEMGVWQRIVTFGNRGYSYIMNPVWNWVFPRVLRQPGFLSAVENGLNPLQRVTPDSSVGRRAGLQESIRVGVNRPYLNMGSLPRVLGVARREEERADRRFDDQMRVQRILGEQTRRVQDMAWMLASVIVSQREGIDPVSLAQVAANPESAHTLLQIEQNSEVRRERNILADEVFRALVDLGVNVNASDLETLDPNEFVRYLAMAQAAADRIQAEPRLKRALRSVRARVSPWMRSRLRSAVRYGQKEVKQLRTQTASDFVSSQVEREFVLDHIQVGTIFALYGARADLSNPEELAAQTGGILWTNPEHMFDVAYNTYVHFFAASSSMALVYDAPREPVATRYLPVERDLALVEHSEHWAGAMGRWFYNVLNLKRSDVGSIYLRRLVKSLAAIQAGIVMNTAARVMVGGQSPGVALTAFGFSYWYGIWAFGWPWTPIQQGNNIEEAEIEERQAKMREAIADLSQGLREWDQTSVSSNELSARLDSGIQKMTELMQGMHYSDRRAFRKRMQVTGDSLEREEITAPQLESIIQSYDARTLGVALEYAQALKVGDTERAQVAHDALVNTLSNTVDAELLRRLSARGLLEVVLEKVPFATKASKFPSWMMTQVAAASTTIMATYFSVATFDPANLTIPSVLKVMTLSLLGQYFFLYKGLKKDGWVVGIWDRIQRLRGKKSCEAALE